MTKIDVTPEAIAKRRAAGLGPQGDTISEELKAFCKALAPLGWALLVISACLFFVLIR